MNVSGERVQEFQTVLLGEVTVECSVSYDCGPGLEPATSGIFCACDSAFSSSVCSSKQADFAASRAADMHSEQNDVMMEILELLLNNDDDSEDINACVVAQQPSESCISDHSKFFSWDDLWDSNPGPAPDLEMDFMDDWMLDAEMFSLDGV